MGEFERIPAKVERVRGIPRLFVDGRMMAPNLLMPIRGPQPEIYRSEIARAARHGVPLVCVCLDGTVERTVDEVLACAPDAKIVLRIAFPVDMRTRGFTGHNYVNQYGEEMPSYSYASEAWFRYTAERVTEVVEAVGAYAPAAGHVIGYHIGAGDSGEWLGPYFWEAYIDCSPVNRQRFSAFLAERYGTDGALREAWDDPAVSLEDDLIPRRLPGTECLEMFHAYGAFEDRFLTGRKYRRYTDYLEYYNGLAAQRITALAALVKRLTGRRSLAMFFTGYHTEARLPHSGQYALHRILQSPDIDAICAPVSYDDRNEGGKGPSMGPIQSIEAFGKLWMDEADYRSPVRKTQGNSEVAGGLDTGGYCRSVEGLLEVAARQLGKCMVYGGSAWWFDMVGRGWYDFDEFWQLGRRFNDWYEAYMRLQRAASPDVAFITDENARFIEGDPWACGQAMLQMREPLYACGLSCGWFLLQDLLEGHLPDTRLVVLLQPWRLDHDTVERLLPKLEGKTVLLMGGMGQTAPEDFARLCGVAVEKSAGGSTQIRLEADNALPGLSGIVEGPECRERAVCADGTVLGRYADGTPAMALAADGRGMFCGGAVFTPAQLRALARQAGGHVFADSDDVVFADSGLVVLHARSGGSKTIAFPEVCDIYDAVKNRWFIRTDRIEVPVDNQTTRLFFYGEQAVMQAAGLG